MLLIKTYLDKSPIHGIGVFAGEFVRKDTKIWRFAVGFDRYYSRKQFAKLPKPARDYIKLHGYRWGSEILVPIDNDAYMNHSDNSNTYFRGGYVLARRNIRQGIEITNDYSAFDTVLSAGFLKAK